jgi:hypothetical protein
MKKLIIMLVVVSAVAVTSFKKDSEVSPLKADITVKMNGGDEPTSIDKSNVSTWD